MVRASFLGVGAPEAFVIAVVSLLVFGPKGLAEVRSGGAPALRLRQLTCASFHLQIAKNLGQTLRAFQPTIKELQQVSQEFKSALEQEARLDVACRNLLASSQRTRRLAWMRQRRRHYHAPTSTRP